MKDRILDTEEAQFDSNKTQSAILNSAISRTQNNDSWTCYASIEISTKKKLTLTWINDTITKYIKNNKIFYTTPHAASFEDIKGRAYNPNAMETDLKLHASAVTHQANNVVTKAVWNHTIKDNEISTHTVQLAKWDLIFWGTDGITDYVWLQEIQDIVNQNTDHKGIVNCQKVMTEVSLLAYQRNSHDNVSFTIMQIQ